MEEEWMGGKNTVEGGNGLGQEEGGETAAKMSN